MSRLTIRGANGVTAPGVDIQSLISRLASYEDSGLPPDYVQILSKAKRAKRLMIQPCDVGERLFRVVILRHGPGSEEISYSVRPTTLSHHTALDVMREYNQSIFKTREKALAKAKKLNRELEEKIAKEI